MNRMIGTQSCIFENHPCIAAAASVVGPKEGQGPLGSSFDIVWADEKNGTPSWEKAESLLMQTAITEAIRKAGLTEKQIRWILAGDLLNQIGASHFAIRDFQIPFLGMFGACSTMSLTLMNAAMLINAGYGNYAAAAASSHFCSSEKQFRMPLNYGSQRPLYATWTVTGSGCCIVARNTGTAEPKVCITGATTGRIIDMGIKDAFNMGAAMAPAAADTILTHFHDFHRTPDDYDLIITGDLGIYGSRLMKEMLEEQGIAAGDRFTDCGILIYDPSQDTHAGGSGCGCSAVTLAAHLIPNMLQGIWNRILFVPTGALLSQLSTQQGESIPCIAHAVVLERFS